MKKLIFGTFLGIFAIAGIAVLPNSTLSQFERSSTEPPRAQPGELVTPTKPNSQQQTTFNNNNESRRTYQTEGAPTIGSITGQYKEYNPDVYGKDKLQDDNLIVTIKNAINRVLGILAFIALLLCLRGGLKMMISGGDQKGYEAGINLIKWAAIGLVIIAISWLIVSLVFYIINGTVERTK